MTSNIHANAIIDPSAKIAENVKIAPFAIVGPDVIIEAGAEIAPHAYLEHCEIGKNSIISSGAIIGTAPQDLGYKGEPTKVIIGDNCQIREHVTVNRASGEGNITKVGNNCMLMTGSHVAHNCKLADNVILANLATLGGHVSIEQYAFIGGMVVLHQHVRVGEMAIIGGFSGARQDIPPYAKTDGRPAGIIGLNTIGLKRRGLTPDERKELKAAFNCIWFAGLNTKQGIEKIRKEVHSNKYVEHLIDFIESSKRGVTKISGKQAHLED